MGDLESTIPAPTCARVQSQTEMRLNEHQHADVQISLGGARKSDFHRSFARVIDQFAAAEGRDEMGT